MKKSVVIVALGLALSLSARADRTSPHPALPVPQINPSGVELDQARSSQLACVFPDADGGCNHAVTKPGQIWGPRIHLHQPAPPPEKRGHSSQWSEFALLR